MVEIAISLAVIGFALVAIIGVLPIGMDVQKANREETILNQDASVFMNAIRNGAQGLDDLTNYVMAITNYVTEYDYPSLKSTLLPPYGYTLTSSSTSPSFPLITGARIVGLLSTPKYVPIPPGKGSPAGGFYSNHVVAYVRSMSGAASEKFPQDSQAMHDLAFSYRMTSEVVPYGTNYFDPTWTNGNPAAQLMALNLITNLYDVRLYFGWPLLTRGNVGKSGESFRTLVGGQLLLTNEPPPFGPNLRPFNLYFFQPRTYVKLP